MLDRHFRHYISHHLKQFCPLTNKQWGFQKRKSTVTGLLSVTHDWLQILENGDEVCTVFFDLQKAFDSVPHLPLLEKLASRGLDDNSFSWIGSYLTDRRQRVVVGGEPSVELPVLSGLPQGSVLGPLLFLMYIDDVSDTYLSDGSMSNLYADDMLLYKPINSSTDFSQLQLDINSINEWVNKNFLHMNPGKCKAMLISRKRKTVQLPQFLLNGTPIQHVKTFKYLGVLLSSDLSWCNHINFICSKAKKLLGILYRRFYESMNSDNLLNLYSLHVRPHLEYAAPVWDPHLIKDTSQIENVQKFALRMCLRKWDSTYYELLHYSELPTLKNRRSFLKQCTLYNIIHGHFNYPPDIFVHKVSRRHADSSHLLHQPRAHTNSFHSSFVLDSICMWNNLPREAHSAPSTNTFKHFISPLFM